MGIGLRLKAVLRDKKITIKQLSEISNISLNTLYSITKRDSENVDPVILQRIADALEISRTYLIGYDQQIIKPELRSEEELKKIKDGAWQAYQESFFENKQRSLLYAFNLLNKSGQEKAIERVEELLEIPKYQRPGYYYYFYDEAGELKKVMRKPSDDE